MRLVEEAALAGRLASRLTTLLHWLDQVPEALLVRRPRLRIYQAWALVINERLDAAMYDAKRGGRNQVAGIANISVG